MDERTERLARNESLFREVNERVEQLNEELGGRSGEFICECSRIDCSELIELTLGEYERARSGGRSFVLFPGHELPELERVVEENEQFMIVEKVGAAGAVADATDPRAPDARDGA
jgi:hypothetical protein